MKRIICFALFAFCGCSDHPDGWEFSTYMPIGTTPERLMEIEKCMMSNGYKRVRISALFLEDAVLIQATKKDGGRE